MLIRRKELNHKLPNCRRWLNYFPPMFLCFDINRYFIIFECSNEKTFYIRNKIRKPELAFKIFQECKKNFFSQGRDYIIFCF